MMKPCIPFCIQVRSLSIAAGTISTKWKVSGSACTHCRQKHRYAQSDILSTDGIEDTVERVHISVNSFLLHTNMCWNSANCRALLLCERLPPSATT